MQTAAKITIARPISKDVFARKKEPINLKAQVSKNIQLFKSSIKQSQNNIKVLSKKIEKRNKNAMEMKENIDVNEEEIMNEKEELEEASQFIQDYKIKKVINVLDICAKQKKAQFLEKIIKKGKTVKSKKLSHATLADKQRKNRKFLEALNKVMLSNGELDYLKPYLDELTKYLDEPQGIIN